MTDPDITAPRCIVCHREHDGDGQTCHRCVRLTRGHLLGIVKLYALLPVMLEAMVLPGRTGGRRGSEPNVPGGDALTLLAGGTHGGVTGSRDGNRDHAHDQQAGDPQSVLAVLASWEDDMRHTFGHEAAGPATVAEAANYLLTRNEWAAQHHPAYDEFAGDMASLHERLMLVSGLIDKPRTEPVRCWDCGGRLQRRYGDLGLVDDARCIGCGAVHGVQRMAMAMAARLRDDPELLLDTDHIKRRWPQVKLGTIRKWVQRGKLQRRGSVDGRALYRAGDIAALLQGDDTQVSA